MSLEKLVISVADVLTGTEGNIIQHGLVRAVWRCGVIEPIMLDKENAHQLGRA